MQLPTSLPEWAHVHFPHAVTTVSCHLLSGCLSFVSSPYIFNYKSPIRCTVGKDVFLSLGKLFSHSAQCFLGCLESFNFIHSRVCGSLLSFPEKLVSFFRKPCLCLCLKVFPFVLLWKCSRFLLYVNLYSIQWHFLVKCERWGCIFFLLYVETQFYWC